VYKVCLFHNLRAQCKRLTIMGQKAQSIYTKKSKSTVCTVIFLNIVNVLTLSVLKMSNCIELKPCHCSSYPFTHLSITHLFRVHSEMKKYHHLLIIFVIPIVWDFLFLHLSSYFEKCLNVLLPIQYNESQWSPKL